MAATKKKTPAKKNQKKKKAPEKQPGGFKLSPKVTALLFALCGVLLLLLFVFIPPAGEIAGAGILLQYCVKFFTFFLGVGRFALPFYLLFLAYAFFRKGKENFHFLRFVIFATVLFLIVPTLCNIGQNFMGFRDFMVVASGGEGGGVLGGFISYFLLLLLSRGVSIAVLIILGLISAFFLTDFTFSGYLKKKKEAIAEKKALKAEEAAMREAEEAKAEAEAKKAAKKQKQIKEEEPIPEDTVTPKNDGALPVSPHRRKRKKVVEYAGEDRILVGGVYFVRDKNFDEESPVTFREHLTGHTEMDDIAPSFDDFKKDPDMDLKAGFYDEFDEDFEPKIFSARELDEPDCHNGNVDILLPAEEETAANASSDVSEIVDPAVNSGQDLHTEAVVFEEIIPTEENKQTSQKGKENDFEDGSAVESLPMSHFSLPKTSILEKGGKTDRKKTAQNIRAGIAKLEQTLESFGVQAKVTDVSCGPSLIRYEVQPGPGVKVSKIVNLADDIALQLAATDVRMEAPIPGKSVIGIEVPRKDSSTVYFRDILENSSFFDKPSKLTCAYGQDIAGNPVIGDLASMPHLLIAGTTGSGKSVCMNTMICSILFKATPDEVKFIMIDPKQVEFVIYEGLPHLITPVVTDPKKAAGALKWALREMENRYTLFNQNRVRNLSGYNDLVENENDRLPQIVIFIDELADLMMVAAKDVEASICRLAQKARAAGIHLVIATQRPSVDVITGLIKANIPSRIALSVSSQTDSRTILDVGGAEKLLGKGDMLYQPIGYSKPLRVQGAWLSDADAVAILDHYKKQGDPDYIEGVAQAVDMGEKNEAEGQYGDALFLDAARAAITAGQVSTSMLQRRFRIGYNHAARIMEELEEKGVVGPADGAKPRAILMSLETFQETFREPKEQSLFDN